MNDPAEQQPCQSCAMPLRADADRGTEAGGGRSADYCRFCYADGRFADASLTLEQQTARLVALAVERGTPEPEARETARRILPALGRWRRS